MTPKITPFLWFDNNLGEALELYASVFEHAKIEHVGKGPDGKVFNATFELEGQRFFALNGGPHYQFSPAISLFVSCETQVEIDTYWAKLTVGGSETQCGWLKDKFGLSWQIVPSVLGKLLGDPDRAKAQRVMNAMLQMKKLDIAGLQAAADQT